MNADYNLLRVSKLFSDICQIYCCIILDDSDCVTQDWRRRSQRQRSLACRDMSPTVASRTMAECDRIRSLFRPKVNS